MKVRLYIRIRLTNGARPYANPVYSANKKLKPFYALVAGKPEHHPEGVYHLRYRKNGKLVWESVGTDPQTAATKRSKQELLLATQEAGIEVVNETSEPEGRPLAEAVAEYLAEVKAAKTKKTYTAYSHTILGFAKTCKKATIEAVDRKDILAYRDSLKEKGNVPRTISNRFMYLKTFVLHFGLPWPLLKTDRVRYTEKEVSAYSAQEIQSLLAVANQDETELIQFLLCTGVREQEAEYATWRDVDFEEKTYTVREKLDMGFTPKDKEEGSIPIPDLLVQLLRARRERCSNSRLIFPRPNGKAEGHFLRVIKELALKAGLNCGECYNKAGECCATSPT
jgi:integrase